MKKPMFFSTGTLLLCLAISTFANSIYKDVCPPPGNVTLTAQTKTSASFDWDHCSCGTPEYHVYYVKNGQTGPQFITGNSEITITGLTAGTYQFYFYSQCGGVVSAIIVEEVIM
ncbi:MAG: fibronectin type III domain-containing protein [Lewinellaceae bacterium]|nr:fibronectin type III domain-containing protein [Saprospiraceae bacterium]MCB9316962.1 fibronectin type III domain-containing protein [Lewinellaceae bacterium]MCB9331860.1 fibronectin type III domain-containing protein [Lewinellaceae bacterium]